MHPTNLHEGENLMIRRTRGRSLAALVVVATVVAACGDDDGGSADTTKATDTTEATDTTSGGSEPTDTTVAGDTTVPVDTTAPEPSGWTVNTDDCADPDAANAAIEGTLKIGSIMPLSGGVAATAFAPVKEGFDAYVKYANENGLLGDVTLELQIEDDQYTNLELTVSGATKLIEDGAHIFSGVIGSPNNGAIRDTLNAECIPQLMALTGSPAWGEVADYPWTTGALVPYTVESQIYATQIGQDFPDGSTAALFHVSNEFGQVYADAFEEIAGDFGIDIVETQTIEATDAAPPVAQMTAIAEQKPDVIMAVPLGSGCITFLSELAAQKAADPSWTPTLYITNTCASSLILGAAGAAADGLFTSSNLLDINDPANADNPAVTEYLSYLEGLGKKDFAPTAIAGWHAAELTVAVLKQAMDSPEGLTRASIMNASRNFEYTPTLARPGVVAKLSGEDDVFLVESLQVVQYDFAAGTFSDVGELITEYES
jgi:ABC-type branched-subunit amino acid transport system substrate-binding protein